METAGACAYEYRISDNEKTQYDEAEHFTNGKTEIAACLTGKGRDWVKRRRRDKKSTAPGIPRRSPIQVLTGPDVA